MLPKNFPVFVAEKKQLVFTPSIMTALPVIVEIAGRLRYHHTNTRSRNDYFKTPPQSLNISLAETFYLWLTRARCSGCADEGSPHWRTCAREVHLVCVWSKSIVRGQLAWLRALNTRFANRPANPRAASSSSTQLILVCIFVCSSSQ